MPFFFYLCTVCGLLSRAGKKSRAAEAKLSGYRMLCVQCRCNEIYSSKVNPACQIEECRVIALSDGQIEQTSSG